VIVGTRPRFRQILAEVWKPLTVLFCWDVLVTAFHFYTPFSEPPLPTTLFGTALALFLGFRTNAAYARWWEARSLWGALINASRSLARATKSFFAPDRKANVAVDDVILRQIAIAHALRCQLRGQDPMPEIERLIGADAAATIALKANRANALAEEISALVADAHLSGRIDTIQQATLERLLIDISNAQGGMERIKNTPLPNGFRFFPNLFTRVFCVLVPIALVESLGIYTPLGSTLIGLIFLAALSIGEDLTDPFANSVHDVPLTAMSRTIEIDLLQSLNREAPPKLEPVHGTLW
jgi:ion channel-forming bestrophin family protein